MEVVNEIWSCYHNNLALVLHLFISDIAAKIYRIFLPNWVPFSLTAHVFLMFDILVILNYNEIKINAS